MDISKQYLQESLAYSPETGKFVWKYRPSSHFKTESERRRFNKRYAGSVAGYKSDGYTVIMAGKKVHRAHNLAWLAFYGEWPRHELDHINHDRADNRIANLREAPNFENHRNKSIYKNNTSGIVGVRWYEREKKWRAKIQIRGKTITLLRHNDIFEVICARKSAENKYGFHRNHGAATKTLGPGVPSRDNGLRREASPSPQASR